MKYFVIRLEQDGFESIEFWKELTDEQRDALVEEEGALEFAVEDTAGVGTFFVVDETKLRQIHEQIGALLERPTRTVKK